MNIVVIGASGSLGASFIRAFVRQTCLEEKPSNIFAFTRQATCFESDNVLQSSIDLSDEKSIASAAALLDNDSVDKVIVASGVLHNAAISPEKSIRSLSMDNFQQNFIINTFGPALVMKYFLPKLKRQSRSVFACLSARVGSISDNRLGGWYSYRASKAALNMLIRTAAIEVSRSHKQAVIVGLHPGTVDSPLSKPYQKGVPDGKLFSSDFSVQQLLGVIETLTPNDSGNIYAWDGKKVPA